MSSQRRISLCQATERMALFEGELSLAPLHSIRPLASRYDRNQSCNKNAGEFDENLSSLRNRARHRCERGLDG